MRGALSDLICLICFKYVLNLSARSAKEAKTARKVKSVFEAQFWRSA